VDEYTRCASPGLTAELSTFHFQRQSGRSHLPSSCRWRCQAASSTLLLSVFYGLSSMFLYRFIFIETFTPFRSTGFILKVAITLSPPPPSFPFLYPLSCLPTACSPHVYWTRIWLAPWQPKAPREPCLGRIQGASRVALAWRCVRLRAVAAAGCYGEASPVLAGGCASSLTSLK